MQVLKQDFFAVKRTAMVIHAPFSGRVLPQSESSNPLVSNKLLGLGADIEVTNYQLCAPFSGTLVSVRQAGLEFVFKSKQGLKLLVLITLSSNQSPMTGYKQHIKIGAQFKAGDLIASFDFRQQKAVFASVLILDPARITKVIDKCYYQANRVTAANDILFKLTKRINND